VEAVYPELPFHSARLISAGEGQYNDLFIVNEQVVFRFPRFPQGVSHLPRLARILTLVQRHATIATPEPRYLSIDRLQVGYAFLGYPLIAGEPLRRSTLDALAAQADAAPLRRIAEQLATFLRALHGISAEAIEAALPGKAAGFRPLAEWEALYARIRRVLFPHMRADARAAVAARFEAFLGRSAYQHLQPALVHGDFGAGNWLYDPVARRVTGVVDFDSCGLGDPAVDIAAGAQGPVAFVEQFLTTYGVTGVLEARARFYRTTFLLQEALYGAEHGDAEAFAAIEAFR